MLRLPAAALPLALALAAHGRPPLPPAKDKVYKTPQAVFDAAMAASRKKDFKAAVTCLAPEAQKDMAAGFAYAALNIKEGNTEEVRKGFKPLFDVLERHGLTGKATKDIQTGDDPKTAEKSRLALRRLIKDHAAFAAEYLAAQDKVGGGERRGETKIRLADLKIDGEKATGTMVVDFGGSEDKRLPVEFVKIGGGWKMIPEPRPAAKGKEGCPPASRPAFG
jgi:hypothetical protein